MRKAHNRLDIDVKYIVQEYLSGKSSGEIASELGVGNHVILTRLREEGVPRREQPKYPEVTKEVLTELYVNQKMSTRAIGAQFGCSNKLILKRLTKFGIPTRLHAGDPAFNPQERKEMYGMQRESHPLWKGGVTVIQKTLRLATQEWRERELKRNDFTCFITNKRGGDLHVHHTTPFHVLRGQAEQELGISLNETIADYDEATVGIIRTKFAELHEGERGYAVKPELHKLFHHHYGFKTTEADFHEFKQRYLLGEFTEKAAI